MLHWLSPGRQSGILAPAQQPLECAYEGRVHVAAGAFSDGPYGIQNPEDFFRPGYYPYAFNPEVGSVGVPVAETLRYIFPDPEEHRPPSFTQLPDDDWQVCAHDQLIPGRFMSERHLPAALVMSAATGRLVIYQVLLCWCMLCLSGVLELMQASLQVYSCQEVGMQQAVMLSTAIVN